MKKVLITAALPYINNVPHLGHLIGSHLPADVFARYCRSKGLETIFVGGSDEYGTPSVIAAKQAGKGTQQFVDELHEVHKKIYRKMNISYDIYSRTSSDLHNKNVQEFFLSIDPKFLEEKEEELFYSEADQMFLPDRFLIGECPSCGSEANSDQCEKCGKILSAKELLHPRSTLSNTTPVLKKTKHIYLKLDLLSDQLNNWLDTKKDIFKKNVYSEAKKWIEELRSRSITRDMSWGVKVPKKGYEDKVFYVWFDAPIGYMSFAKALGKDWESYDAYHFLGKDNIPFHTIFWPAMLISANKKLPYNVVGYNYLSFEGQKFSKSKNIGIFCNQLLDIDIDIDVLRFYLMFSLPESKDADFKWEDFIQVVNSKLIGNIANFFNRTVSMTNRYLTGEISLDKEPENELLAAHAKYIDAVDNLFQKCELRNALNLILEFSSLGNQYIEKQEPWKIKDREALTEVLYTALEHSRVIATMLRPFIPDKMSSFLENQLKSFDKIALKHSIGEAKPLFQRLDEEFKQKIINI